MIKRMLLAIVVPFLFVSLAHADRVKCQEAMTADDIIAIDQDVEGNVVEYKRNADDIQKVIAALKRKISDDPTITQSPYWEERMLSTTYWAKERCGGTKDCSSKECPSGNSCVYRSLGMAGCRCEKD